jgi:predicted permease
MIYGDDLLRSAEDAVEEVWRRHGAFGLLRLLGDLAVRVPAEHVVEVAQDIRYGTRTILTAPGVAFVAIVSLGLGIAIATIAFTEIYASILRDLPAVERPDELVSLQTAASYRDFERYRDRAEVFNGAFAYIAPVPFGVTAGSRTERVWGHLVTPEYFAVMGIKPALGRVFDPQDRQRGQAPTVVVSHRFWQTQLASDPRAVGGPLRVNGQACTIIGVGPREFLGASPMMLAADLWIPALADPRIAPELSDHALDRRDIALFQVVGRLKPGVTIERAEAELDTVARQIEAEGGSPDRERKERRVLLASGGKVIPVRSQDLPMFVGFPIVLVGLVLLIACSNVGNMMIARAASRRKEIAIRLAVGAGRGRIVRQLLTESAILAVTAGAAGFLLARWLLGLMNRIDFPYPIPISMDLTPDLRVLLFTLVLSLFTSIAFGLAPALQATRADVTPALKEGGNVRLPGHRRFSLRNMLVVYQVAGSLMLLMITGLLVLGFNKSAALDVGFSAANLQMISLDPIRDGYSGPQAADCFEKLSERTRRMPGVRSASLTQTVPLGLTGHGSVKFYTAGGERVLNTARKYMVGAGYFETLETPMLAGRGFTQRDEKDDSTAVIVNETLVREFWKGENPVGRRIEIAVNELFAFDAAKNMRSFDNASAPLDPNRRIFEVVGVARDVKMEFVMEHSRPAVYFPLRPAEYMHPALEGVVLVIRSTPGVDVASGVRQIVAAMDPKLTVFNSQTMSGLIDRMMFLVRMGTGIYGTIGIFGLILASVGLAGVTAYSVVQRAREIGIRIALGARKRDVLGLVMREGAVLIAVGSAIGFAGAWAGSRALASAMSSMAKSIGASAGDPLLLVGAPALLAGLALLSCYVPARRSMRIDPIKALRQD